MTLDKEYQQWKPRVDKMMRFYFRTATADNYSDAYEILYKALKSHKSATTNSTLYVWIQDKIRTYAFNWRRDNRKYQNRISIDEVYNLGFDDEGIIAFVVSDETNHLLSQLDLEEADFVRRKFGLKPYTYALTIAQLCCYYGKPQVIIIKMWSNIRKKLKQLC